MIIGKAPRAKSHKTLHADVLGCLCAHSIMASVLSFYFSELGPVVSRAKSDLRRCLGHRSALHWRWDGIGSSSCVCLDEFCIYKFTSCRCLEVQKILLFQPRHSVELPGIHRGHLDVPLFVSASVGIHGNTLIN